MDWASSADGYGTGFFDTIISGVNGGSIHHQTVGKVRTIFQWVRDLDENMEPDVNDNPPDFLPLKITASAWAAAGSDTSMQARNTSKEHVSVSAMDETPTSSDHDYQDWMSGAYMTSNDAHAKKLVMVATNGQDVVRGPWVDLEATATVDGNRVLSHYDFMMGSWDEYLPGGTQLSLTYSAAPDDRTLYLTRPGAVAETRNGTTTYGHSRFSHKSFDGLIFTNHNVTQQYIRHVEGSWGTDGEWNWSPVGDDETAIDSTQTNEFGSMDKDVDGNWYGSPTTPRVQTTTYTLKDPNDGAVGTATYELILHDEFEFKNENAVTQSRENFRAHPNAIPVRATTPNQSLTVGVSNGYSWTVGGSFGGNIQASKIIGLSLGVEVSRTATTASTAVATINDVPAGWETYLEIYDIYDVRTGTSYQWSDAGYVGEANWEIKEPSQNPACFGIQAAVPYDTNP